MKKDLTLPKGVKIRGERIQIFFIFEGRQCRELLRKRLEINHKSIKYAENKLNAIRTEIAEGRFDYRSHFPSSPRALQFEGSNATDPNRTVESAIELWLEVAQESLATSTIVGYTSKANRVKSYFKSQRLNTIKKIDITRFRKNLIEKEALDIKTVNDVFTILRQTFLLAKHDGIIKENVLDTLPNLKLDDDTKSQSDPYTEKELAKIQSLKQAGYARPQAINMFLFTCYTGLSFSEAIALAWEDLDLKTMTLKVQRARVENEFKVPKEKSRTRTFELLEPASKIILGQYKYTFAQESLEIDVRRRSNVNMERQSIRFIFKNERPECLDGLWKKKAVQLAYAAILQEAEIRYRPANQCRHTFCSSLITKFVPLDIVASLMGHTSIKMLQKHYGAIIQEDRPNVARIISEIIGIDYAEKSK